MQDQAKKLRLGTRRLKLDHEFDGRRDARAIDNREVSNRMTLREPSLQYHQKKPGLKTKNLRLRQMDPWLSRMRATSPYDPASHANDPLNYGSFEDFRMKAVGPWTDEALKMEWDISHPVPETIPPDPSVAGKYADSYFSPRTRQRVFGILNPTEAVVINNLISDRIVANFQKRIGLRQNDPNDLERIGINYERDKKKGVGTNGSQENAFRHTYGQVLATALFGRASATEAASAHEEHPDIETSRRVFMNENNPIDALFQADTVADLLNNEIGRQIGERTLTKNAKELAIATLEEFYKKGLYTCEFLGHGLVRVRRESLGLEQFSEGMDLMSRLNSMGLTADEDQLQRSTEKAGWQQVFKEIKKLSR
jgi:uncharacterized protein DUF6973